MKFDIINKEINSSHYIIKNNKLSEKEFISIYAGRFILSNYIIFSKNKKDSRTITIKGYNGTIGSKTKPIQVINVLDNIKSEFGFDIEFGKKYYFQS